MSEEHDFSDVHKIAKENRTIILNGDIDDEVIESTWFHIEHLVAKNSEKNINLCINSYGGLVATSILLADYIRSLSVPVFTYGLGQCYSGAFIILISGGWRTCYRNTSLMTHDISIIENESNTPRITSRSFIKHIDHQYEILLKIMEEQSKLDKKIIKEKISNTGEWYMTPEQAKKYGFIDHIIKPKTYKQLLKEQEQH